MAITIQGTTFQSSVGTPWNIPSGVAMFVQAGSGGTVLDYEATRQRYMAEYGVDPLGLITPDPNSSVGSAAYNLSREYYFNNPSQRFQDLITQYAQQQGNTLTQGMYNSSSISRQPTYSQTPTFDMSTAAGIAAYTARQGGSITADLASIAATEGYSGPLSIVSGREMLATPSKTYAADVARTGATTILASDLSGPSATFYAPVGSYYKVELPDSKAVYSAAGEIGIYSPYYINGQLSKYLILSSSGGRNALQSGMFTVNDPMGSDVLSRTDLANFTSASALTIATKSRSGAEAYGGYEGITLDNRTIESTGAKLSTYANPANLANLVSPESVNLGKAELPGAAFPWTINAGSPTIQLANQYGLTGKSMNIEAQAQKSAGVLDLSAGTYSIIGGETTKYTPISSDIDNLPSPFKSSTANVQTILVPSSIDLAVMNSPIGNTVLAAAIVGASDFLLGGRTIITKTETPFSITIPSPYVSNAPEGYTTQSLTLSGTNIDVTPTKLKSTGGEALAQAFPVLSNVDIVADVAVPLLVAAAGGAAFGVGESLIGRGIAAAATSDIAGVSTIGRLASTPLASDIALSGKIALGGYALYSGAQEILSQPTIEGGIFKAAIVAGEFGAFGAGYKYGTSLIGPAINPYAGVKYFSGETGLGPIESTIFKAQTKIVGSLSQNPEAYADIVMLESAARFIKPQKVSEPVLEEATYSGQYAPEIKETLLSQTSTIIGSASVRSQYSSEIVAETGLRIPKDVDVLVQDTTGAISKLSGLTGLSEKGAAKVIDVHPYSDYINYPLKGARDISSSKISTDSLTDTSILEAFKDPFRAQARPRSSVEVISSETPGYSGELGFESASVQVGRKGSASALAISDPLRYGYRFEKDIYDLLTIYQAQRASAISSGVPESSFKASDIAFSDILSKEVTYGTVKMGEPGQKVITRSIGDIYSEYMGLTKSGVKISDEKISQNLPSAFEITAQKSVIPSGILISEFASTRIDQSIAASSKRDSEISPSLSMGSSSLLNLDAQLSRYGSQSEKSITQIASGIISDYSSVKSPTKSEIFIASPSSYPGDSSQPLVSPKSPIVSIPPVIYPQASTTAIPSTSLLPPSSRIILPSIIPPSTPTIKTPTILFPPITKTGPSVLSLSNIDRVMGRKFKPFYELYHVGNFENIAGNIFGGSNQRRSTGRKLKIGKIKI